MDLLEHEIFLCGMIEYFINPEAIKLQCAKNEFTWQMRKSFISYAANFLSLIEIANISESETYIELQKMIDEATSESEVIVFCEALELLLDRLTLCRNKVANQRFTNYVFILVFSFGFNFE